MASKQKPSCAQRGPSQVVGFRNPQPLARDVKAEAGKRGLKLNRLFAEMWELYRKQKLKKVS